MKRMETMIKGRLTYLIGIGVALLFMSSCTKNSPGLEFMPDMYRSPAIEPNITGNRLPAENTIPRGYMPFNYPNTLEAYELAGKELKNPLEYNEQNLKDGKALYMKFCAHCHGKTGKADGGVIKNSSFPPPPPYDGRIKDLPAGKIFFSITYGKNLMGPHASQLTEEERWKLVFYVQKLQGHNLDELYADKPAETSVETLEEAE